MFFWQVRTVRFRECIGEYFLFLPYFHLCTHQINEYLPPISPPKMTYQHPPFQSPNSIFGFFPVFFFSSHLCLYHGSSSGGAEVSRLDIPSVSKSSLADAFMPNDAMNLMNLSSSATSLGMFGWKELTTWHICSVIALFPKRPFELIVGFYMWAPGFP